MPSGARCGAGGTVKATASPPTEPEGCSALHPEGVRRSQPEGGGCVAARKSLGSGLNEVRGDVRNASASINRVLLLKQDCDYSTLGFLRNEKLRGALLTRAPSVREVTLGALKKRPRRPKAAKDRAPSHQLARACVKSCKSCMNRCKSSPCSSCWLRSPSRPAAGASACASRVCSRACSRPD